MVINTILGQRFLNRFLFSLKKINEKDKENDLGILLTLPQGGFLSFFLGLYRKKGHRHVCRVNSKIKYSH